MRSAAADRNDGETVHRLLDEIMPEVWKVLESDSERTGAIYKDIRK